MIGKIKGILAGWQATLVAGGVCFALGASSAGLAAWNWQKRGYESKISKMRLDAAEAVIIQSKLNDSVRQLKDEKEQAREALFAERKRKNEVRYETVVEERVKYITQDPNAHNCGFNDRGVCVWNQAAAGGGVSETQGPACTSDGEAIAASNADIQTAGAITMQRHHACILQVEELQQYVCDEVLDEDSPLCFGRQ